MRPPSCDVVVPVYGALDAVDDCLHTVLAYTPALARLIVVDDGSDPHVAAWLDGLAAVDARVSVVHTVNQGFVRAANRGLRESSAACVCLLNSDTLVTPGWLEGMLRCAARDPRIAVVNPVSNAAVNLSVQMAPGLDVFRMAQAVAAASRRTDPDVVTAVGFCLLLTREALERAGVFDEAYGQGYCEESDYCMRVTGMGLRVVVADDVFVYHRGGASFDRSRERYLQNRRIFDARWGDRYPTEYDAFMRRDPLGYLRAALAEGLEAPSDGDDALAPGARTELLAPRHTPLGRLWAMTADAWRQGGVLEVARKLPVAHQRLGEAVQAALGTALPDARSSGPPEPAVFADPQQPQRRFATPEYVRTLPQGRGLRIAVLVWRFDVYGGVLAIVELVNRLVLDGHSVTVATVDDRGMEAAFTLYARPLVFRGPEALIDGLPPVDVVLATFWPTASEWLPGIRRRQPAAQTVYFVQDYEAWFLPEEEQELRARVVRSYGLADRLIVTTPWLREKVAAHGYEPDVIPYGIDTRIFYPRPSSDGSRSRNRRARVLVQARPSAPWRGFPDALAVFERLAERVQGVEAVFFGCSDDELRGYRIRFPFQNAGVVSDRHAVARLYSSCDALFDPSRFQAFGLPGLEAMACGVPAVLPREGGCAAYAVHESNALVIPAGDVDARVAALERVLDDARLRTRLIENGLATAARFSVGEMTRRHLEVYRGAGRPAPMPQASVPG